MQNEHRAARDELQTVKLYAAELELEVDRLRRREQFLQQQMIDGFRQIAQVCLDTPPTDAAAPLKSIAATCRQCSELLRDLQDFSGYHPAFDQVIAVAIRPLAEQVFRWQQRLSGASNAVLRLDLETDHVIWFPARLRHILDNLISNSLKYCDPAKAEMRVGLSLRATLEGYELHLTDNGLGIPIAQANGIFELFYRAAPAREAGLGVGLAVVKLLVEQCCGSITVKSGAGQGTDVTVILPRYDLDDYVDRTATTEE